MTSWAKVSVLMNLNSGGGGASGAFTFSFFLRRSRIGMVRDLMLDQNAVRLLNREMGRLRSVLRV